MNSNDRSEADAFSAGYDAGHADGYRMGEHERIALAVANSDLRSELRELQRLCDR